MFTTVKIKINFQTYYSVYRYFYVYSGCNISPDPLLSLLFIRLVNTLPAYKPGLKILARIEPHKKGREDPEPPIYLGWLILPGAENIAHYFFSFLFHCLAGKSFYESSKSPRF